MGNVITDMVPKVSIIINCYNGEEYLREAMDSVVSQSFQDWEIVFWDNQSEDSSAAIAKSYGPKIQYFLAPVKTNLGHARNLALQKARGEYITFIDCDDVWMPEKLQLQVELMDNNPSFALCYAGIEEILPDGTHFRNVPTIYESGFLFPQLLLQYDVNILTSMIRRSMLDETGLSFDNQITASEEYCLFMQLASSYDVGVVNRILAKYRVHETSLTSKSLNVLGKERRYTLDKIVAEKPGIEKKYHAAFKEAYARADYYDARWYMSNGKHFSAFKALRRNATLNVRYFALMLLSLMPVSLWNAVHLKYRNRV